MSSGVEFDEDKFSFGAPSGQAARYGRATSSAGVPKMSAWLMKKGIVKSPMAAQIFLIGLILFNVIITYVAIKYFL